MTRINAAAVAGGLLLIFMATMSAGQTQRGRMMMGNYHPKAEVTIQGTIEQIIRMGNPNMPGMGIHLMVKADNETTEVHLGPAAFVDKTMTFKENDSIQVTGSKVTMMGRTVVIAWEVRKGDAVLKLRDDQGMPFWPWMRMHRWVS